LPDTKPPRNAGKAALVIVAIIAAVWAIVFFGLNLSHHNAAQNEEQGQLPPDTNAQDAKPQGPHDLGTEPRSHK
jgi:cell division protein FtsN